MHDFQYVTKNELKPIKNRIIELIRLVQNEIRSQFTFREQFIGSVERNMVTYDSKSNIGFDFDINLTVNDDEYSPKEIKHILMRGFDKFARKYNYDYCEDRIKFFTL